MTEMAARPAPVSLRVQPPIACPVQVEAPAQDEIGSAVPSGASTHRMVQRALAGADVGRESSLLILVAGGPVLFGDEGGWLRVATVEEVGPVGDGSTGVLPPGLADPPPEFAPMRTPTTTTATAATARPIHRLPDMDSGPLG